MASPPAGYYLHIFHFTMYSNFIPLWEHYRLRIRIYKQIDAIRFYFILIPSLPACTFCAIVQGAICFSSSPASFIYIRSFWASAVPLFSSVHSFSLTFISWTTKVAGPKVSPWGRNPFLAQQKSPAMQSW